MRELIIPGNRRYTYAQSSTVQPARVRTVCPGWVCKRGASTFPVTKWWSDRWASYAHNVPEYVEAMLGVSWRPRLRRSTSTILLQNELHYGSPDFRRTALIYHGEKVRAAGQRRASNNLPKLGCYRKSPTVGQRSRTRCRGLESIVGSGVAELRLFEPSTHEPVCGSTPGATTGMPKGLLWRQHDIFMTSFSAPNRLHRRACQLLRRQPN